VGSTVERPPTGPGSEAPPAGLGAVLALSIGAALALSVLLGSILVALLHPQGAVAHVFGLEDQSQTAKTLTYVLAVAVISPLCVVFGPRLADAIARGPNRQALVPITAALWGALAAALIVVRLLPHLGVHDGTREVLAATALLGVAFTALVVAAIRGRRVPGLHGAGRSPSALFVIVGALLIGVALCLTDLGKASALGLLVGVALAAVALGVGRVAPLARWPRLRRAGPAVDVLAVLVLALAVVNVVVYTVGGIPNSYFPPGIIQFHQDWLLGPANQLLGGGALLDNVPVSQYGVGFIYFLAAWFHIAPIGYGTYGLLDGIVTALFYVCAYGLLRIAGVGRPLAVSALALAVVAFIYHLYYSVGELPQQGPLRFGLPMAVVLAETAALRWPGGRRALRAIGLLALGVAAVWSLEMLAYTLATYLAVIAYRAWLREPPRRPALVRDLAFGVGACLVAHVVLAAWTLIATGHLPDWGQYLTYVDALVLGNQAAGQISYGFAPWSPALAVGAGGLASAIAVILVIRRAPHLVRAEPIRFLVLTGLSTYAVVLFSYTDNRSSTYLLPYVSLPLLLVAVLWLSLVLSPRVGLGTRARRIALGLAVSVAGIMVAAAWPSIGTLFSQSALAHAYPGGGLRGALHRLWHAPPIDPRSPQGVALLDRYAPGKRALVLLPDLPDLGTEILMRGHRANALFIGDPKADGFIDPSEWTGKLTAQLAALRPGTRVLTDPAGLLIAAELRGTSPEIPLHHPIGQFNPQIEWILQRVAARFTLHPIARARSGLVIARLRRR
jgi:hypothetical protein